MGVLQLIYYKKHQYATYLKIYISLTHNLFKKLKMFPPEPTQQKSIFLKDSPHDQSYIPNFIPNSKAHNKGVNIRTEGDWAKSGGNWISKELDSKKKKNKKNKKNTSQ